MERKRELSSRSVTLRRGPFLARGSFGRQINFEPQYGSGEKHSVRRFVARAPVHLDQRMNSIRKRFDPEFTCAHEFTDAYPSCSEVQ
jgi:hypothetical protein